MVRRGSARVVLGLYGVDGSGKTTLVRALEEKLTDAGLPLNSIAGAHFDVFLASARRSEGIPTKPATHRPRGFLLSFVLLLRRVLRFRMLLFRSRSKAVLIWDRPYRDILFDPSRYRINQRVAKLVPLVDLLMPNVMEILLTIDVSRECSRNTERTPELATKVQDGMIRFADCNGWLRFDTEALSPQEIASQIVGSLGVIEGDNGEMELWKLPLLGVRRTGDMLFHRPALRPLGHEDTCLRLFSGRLTNFVSLRLRKRAFTSWSKVGLFGPADARLLGELSELFPRAWEARWSNSSRCWVLLMLDEDGKPTVVKAGRSDNRELLREIDALRELEQILGEVSAMRTHFSDESVCGLIGTWGRVGRLHNKELASAFRLSARIRALGFVLEDPSPWNFVRTSDGVRAIDISVRAVEDDGLAGWQADARLLVLAIRYPLGRTSLRFVRETLRSWARERASAVSDWRSVRSEVERHFGVGGNPLKRIRFLVAMRLCELVLKLYSRGPRERSNRG